MTVGDLRKILDKFTDDDVIVYGWTWTSPVQISRGRYCGIPSAMTALILDGDRGYVDSDERFGNELLYRET